MASKTKHPLYPIWANLRKREPNAQPEWLLDFDQFLLDVGDKPHPKARLVKKDKALGYTRENTKWYMEKVYMQSSDKDIPDSPMARMRWLRENVLQKPTPEKERSASERTTEMRRIHGLDWSSVLAAQDVKAG